MTQRPILAHTKTRVAILALVFTIVLSACARLGDEVLTETVGTVPEALGPAYLKERVLPCLPLAGSQTDPCGPGITEVDARSVSLSLLWPSRNSLPTFEQTLVGHNLNTGNDLPHRVPHIVIRGIVVPDTTRCEPYPRWSANYRGGDIGKNYRTLECFSDVQVNEYTVGVGPPRLTVILHSERIDHYLTLDPSRNASDWTAKKAEILEKLGDPRARTAAAYEGRELVLFLQPSRTIAVEAWKVANHFHMWFVQRSEDIVIQQAKVGSGGTFETTVTTPGGEDSDQVQAVAQAILWAQTDEQRNQLNIPLTQLVRDVKEAAQTRAATTGGRIGVDPGLPMLVADANKLRDYYIAVGAVYEGDEATVVPPVVVPGIPRNLAVTQPWVVSWDPPAGGGEAHWYRLELRFTSIRMIFITSDRSVNISSYVAERLGQDLDLRVRAVNFTSRHGEWTDTLTYTNIATTAPTTTAPSTTTTSG